MVHLYHRNIYTWYTFATEIFIHGTPLPQKYLYMVHLYHRNIYTWYTFTTEIFKEVEHNKNNFEDFNKPFLLVKDTFKNMFKKTIISSSSTLQVLQSL
jgi:dTDP-4-dehydrorhamnose reductase